MDVSLSILVGLGLCFFLFHSTPNAGPADILTTALLGLWEGAVVHQLSGRSSSPNLDHLLAYGLRLSVDLLFSKNLQRTLMVVLWSALATIASEAIIPHATLRSALKNERERERERRHRRSRSIPAAVPIIAAPLPPRVRAYKPPEPGQPQLSLTTLLPSQPPQTSTPIFPSAERPATPPSFFLQETSALSPSPKPVYIQTLEPIESSPRDALPVRPRSGLATVFDRSPDSGSPLPVPMHLPTPPDSAQSANPSDGLIDVQTHEPYNDSRAPRYERDQLSTILELSPEDNDDTPPVVVNHDVQPDPIDSDDNDEETIQQETVQAAMFGQSSAATNAPLPVPNAAMRSLPSGTVAKWLAYQSATPEADAIFTTPFSPSMSPRGPLPVRLRQQEPLWQTQTPIGDDKDLQATAAPVEEDINANEEVEDTGNLNADSDSDELRTPGQQENLNMETDNENDDDPLLTPKRFRLDEAEGQLSPLGLNLQSVLDNPDYQEPGSPTTPTHQAPDPLQGPEDFNNAGPETEDFPMPGSISQNILLQLPLPPSGPLFRHTFAEPPPESPPPPSPSTIHSDPSDVSVLSTRVPTKLFMRADQLRQKARDEEKVRAQLEEQRKLAESQGRTMDALELKIQVREMDAEAYKLHEKAARRYFVARNPVVQSNKIDVHGLRPREAFDRIERAIVKANQEKRTHVVVIVGKGLHSVNQQPTLKPAVMREMQRLGIKCEVNTRNPGQLIISLPGPSTS
ncbi:hypothetical protein M413DRAFT_442071 [Hebeloma cylindrosporum]|uniref:Smr domain-containing protein n=1 Tax=Hebeloma cylindrosporum TaxID=76867 RepID=A0A0C3CMP9_HEBCY|nr:hypothetical protein M413DRAFT_442071 [Hebeloma cylindrosporum h7]